MILSSTGWWLRIYSHQPSRPGSRNGGCPPAQSSAARGTSTKLRSSIRGWGRVNSGVESRKSPHQSRSRSRLRGPSARGAGDQNAAPDHAGRPASLGRRRRGYRLNWRRTAVQQQHRVQIRRLIRRPPHRLGAKQGRPAGGGAVAGHAGGKLP
jgi:hypothetical protein